MFFYTQCQILYYVVAMYYSSVGATRTTRWADMTLNMNVGQYSLCMSRIVFVYFQILVNFTRQMAVYILRLCLWVHLVYPVTGVKPSNIHATVIAGTSRLDLLKQYFYCGFTYPEIVLLLFVINYIKYRMRQLNRNFKSNNFDVVLDTALNILLHITLVLVYVILITKQNIPNVCC